MFARNRKNARAADPELDRKSLAPRDAILGWMDNQVNAGRAHCWNGFVEGLLTILNDAIGL